jgi:hypothetical protein
MCGDERGDPARFDLVDRARVHGAPQTDLARRDRVVLLDASPAHCMVELALRERAGQLLMTSIGAPQHLRPGRLPRLRGHGPRTRRATSSRRGAQHKTWPWSTSRSPVTSMASTSARSTRMSRGPAAKAVRRPAAIQRRKVFGCTPTYSAACCTVANWRRALGEDGTVGRCMVAPQKVVACCGACRPAAPPRTACPSSNSGFGPRAAIPFCVRHPAADPGS